MQTSKGGGMSEAPDPGFQILTGMSYQSVISVLLAMLVASDKMTATEAHWILDHANEKFAATQPGDLDTMSLDQLIGLLA